MYIETIIGIILTERSLRVNFSYNLGKPLSRRTLNQIKKEIFDFDFNLFEATKILLCLVDLRNNYLHKTENKLFFPSSFLLQYGGDEEEKIRIISSFFLSLEEQSFLFKKIYHDNQFTSDINLNEYVECLKENLLKIKVYQKCNGIDKIVDEIQRHKRNYLLHGYYFNEMNVDKCAYSYEELKLNL